MQQEAILTSITRFTDQAHGTQMRKYAPDRYIVHPVRVMELLKQHTHDIAVLAAALMHDVLEDTPVTKEQLKTFLSTLLDASTTKRTLTLVEELTDKYMKKDYPRMNRRTRKSKELERMQHISSDAQTIKYADIIDNAKEIVTEDPDFAVVFLRECRTLLGILDKGNPQLYAQAQQVVSNALDELKSADKNSGAPLSD